MAIVEIVLQSYMFFSSERKNVAYTFLHNFYTLTFKLLKNSHTRTIHERYTKLHENFTNNRHQIDDIPSKKRHPGMKQTTVYHYFSANMITKKTLLYRKYYYITTLHVINE